MANLAGFDSSAVGHMINHYTRHHGDPEQTKYTYRNQNIDAARTHLNYTIGEPRQDPMAFVREMIAQSDVPPRGGERATNVLSDWIITLPKNELLEGREKEFFEQAYEYLKDKVGEGRIVGAYIHMDEGMPHMHFAFVPLVQTPVMTNDKTRPLVDKNGNIKHDTKGTVRYERVPKLDGEGKPIMRTSLAQSKMFPLKEMKQFHPKLEEKMEQHFGFKVGIQLDEKQVVEKALSNVPQQAMDDTRKALEKELVAPAQAKAVAEVAKADQAKAAAQQATQAAEQAKAVEQQAKQATEVAKGDLVQAQQETQAELERSECLRRDNAAAVERVGELREQVEQAREHALATPDAGDDRQAASQEQQQEHERTAEDQGHSLGERGAGLVRELAEAAQRAGQGEGADARSLDELKQARSASESRIADLEKQRDAVAGRVEELKGAYERAEQKYERAEQSHEAAERKNGEAERRNQLASDRLHDLKSRVAELRERVVERVTELREQLGRAQAIEVFKDVRDRVADGREALRELLTDKVADRVNDALAQHQQPQAEQQQEYSARDWARYEQDRGMER